MRVNLLCVSVFVLCLAGCGAKKRVLQSASVVRPVDTLKVVDAVVPEANLALDSPIVIVKPFVDTLSPDQQFTERALTPEEKVQEQKRTGIHKGADWAGAIHYDLRKPNFVIIHHTSQNSITQTIRTFQVEHSKVSSHYVIGRDGRVVQMLNDYERAWHAGRSKWGQITDMNSMSIGIELDNNGREPFPDPQINSLLILLDTLKTKYTIPHTNFIGHADISPNRKDDPNVFFPWKLLAERGFGVWYDESFLIQPPFNFNPIDALKIIGYDVSNEAAAIRAFKRKYIIKEVNGILTAYDKTVLYNIYKRYY
ncbi:N-acetylmuramoyl-L-alanine amidase [Sphingobacterium pedocola]|uniref:N-acetylmuramoyl-L-alanine amidase n=1 Tax=Sphingobacterium pedocola TaxID=2082722 RepID=A0ABR9T8G4_9SPHI|nr:N-acetylmuramoyl-L-alanine amidase [Sphingobacterium pedocola]MBE8721631.1 N-acetylmuramoyl-L-alanine amidase [Sphingobacterium pedocola]